MKIDMIDLYLIELPLLFPWTTAYGSDDVVSSVLVRMDSGGRSGWGEASPLATPSYSPEYSSGVYAVGRDLIAPLLVKSEIGSGDELQQRLRFIKGNPFAKAAFDLAWWDLAARLRGLPLWKMLGGTRRPLEAGADFGFQNNIDILLEKIDHAVQAGFRRVKLKYGPGWGIEVTKAVRVRFPLLTFHIDCNSAYTLDDLEMFRALDRFGLAMIEQPLAFDDLIDHAKLQAAIATPVCLDESLNSVARARQAIELGAARFFNLKPGRLGGITPTLAVHRMARSAGIPCWIGSMLESGVGLAHLLALASLDRIGYPSDLFPSEHFFKEDILKQPVTFTRCPWFELPDAPGIGFEIDPARLRATTVASVRIS